MLYNQRFYIIHIRYLVYIAVATATYLLLSLSVYLTRVIQSKESLDTCEGDCDVCKIPEPLLLMENWDMNVTESLECANKSLVMFKMNYGSRLERMNLDDDEFWRKVYCCYHSYWRLGSEPDFVLKSTTKCYPIIEDVTEIPNYHEFLDIYCYDIATRSRILYRDCLGNFLVKIVDENSDIVTSDSSLSIAILSIEALSRWNFRRYFPKSHRFILDRLHGVEFSGLHPLNLDRRANFFSLLSGGNPNEFFRACISEDAGCFDSCPFIWRGLVKKGYQTSFQEDRPTFAKYEWWRMELNGFGKSEFDLDLRILTHGVDKFTMGKTHRSNSSKNQECFGSRHRFQYLMDNILLLMDGLKSQLYFHATRVTSLVRSKENLKFSDTVLEKALREMQNRGLLNNTAFIIYSDQGNEGDLAVESQLPLLYIILPPWFRKQYPKAMSNFYGNRNKLISVLHLHQTLMDLSNMQRITDEAIRNRSSVTDRTSLFTRLSSEATCKAADIGMPDCFICSNSSAVKSSDLAVESAATYIIGTINKKLRKNPACAQLRISLPGISSAWQVIVRREIDENGEAESDSPRKNSLITVERTLIFTVTTQPGNMSWRAIVVDKRDGEFVVKSLGLVHSSRNKEKRKQCKTTSIQTELREFCMCNEN